MIFKSFIFQVPISYIFKSFSRIMITGYIASSIMHLEDQTKTLKTLEAEVVRKKKANAA